MVYHEELVRTLRHLDIPAHENFHVSAAERAPVVEVRMSSDPFPRLALRAGQQRQRLDILVPLTTPTVTGPAIALRLDRATLDQMLRTEHWVGDASTWTLRIGKDADFIQFEPDNALLVEPFYSLLRWYYQVRSLE